jgi:hypothetical protein
VGFWRVNPWAILRLLGCQKDRLLIDDWYNHIYQTPSYNMVIFHSYVNVYQRAKALTNPLTIKHRNDWWILMISNHIYIYD